MDLLEKLFDKYNRVARVYPALLAIAPIIWSAAVLFPKSTTTVASGALSVVLAACILFLLSSLARTRGKIVEPRLLAKWGGWPSTIILRHRDNTIDTLTKARYHGALSSLCGGLVLPSEQQEKLSPDQADEIYRSATKKLIEARRGPQFNLLHDENASYGFRRNLYGMRPLLVVISFLCLLLTLSAIWVSGSGQLSWTMLARSAAAHSELALCAVLDGAYLLFCLWIIREQFVFEGAKDYAIALLRTLD